MINLTLEQEKQIGNYIIEVNEVVKCAINFNMKEFIREYGKFICEFKLLGKSDVYSDLDNVEVTPTLNSLWDIVSGFSKDIGRAFNEEILNNKEYQEIDQKFYTKMEDLNTVVSNNYLPFMLFSIKDDIEKELENLDKVDKYSIVLQKLLSSIESIYEQVQNSSQLIKITLDLPVNLLKLDHALLKYNMQSEELEHIKELEQKFTSNYKLLQQEASNYHLSLLTQEKSINLDIIYDTDKLSA